MSCKMATASLLALSAHYRADHGGTMMSECSALAHLCLSKRDMVCVCVLLTYPHSHGDEFAIYYATALYFYTDYL